MDILSLVTLIALAVALSMVVITARLLREERRRSEARIAALSVAAQSDGASDRAETPPVNATAHRTVGRPGAARRDAAAAMRAHQVDARTAVADDFDLHPFVREEPPPVAANQTMFGASGESGRGPSRFVPIVAVGGLILAVVISVVVWSSSGGVSVASRLDTRAAAAQAASSTPPLELVALRHRRDGERLAISGIVKNPSGGRAIKNVSAVVFLFDQNGSFLSSGRAPIDFTTLTPGDESPFVVVVSEPGSVARYRVSFRSDDHVMPHVDRREPGSPNTTGPAVSRTHEASGAVPARLVD